VCCELKIARFVIDTHVHAQRHAVGARKRVEAGEKVNYARLPELYHREAIVYDNSPRLLYDMQCYGIDMCIIQPAFGFTNDLDVEIMKKHPDKFVCLCNAREEEARAKGYTGEWNADAAAEELDRLLRTGNFVGIGEGFPMTPDMIDIPWTERRKKIEKFFDVAAKHKVPISWHASYLPVGYMGGMRRCPPDLLDPMYCHELAAEYPDVTIVMQHGGMEGWWGEWMVERCCHVAASHENVYLEVGMYWAELLVKVLRDPNIGPEKLVWGTDWGASHVVYAQPGQYPSSYITQVRKWGIPAHQPDYWGWCLRQILKATFIYDISQDDLNLVMGGNAVRIWKLHEKVPHRRLFKEYVK